MMLVKFVTTNRLRQAQATVSVQSYKFICQTRPNVKRPGYGYKGRWPGVLARKAPYV